VDGHAEEGVLGPLRNDGGARDMAFPRLNAFSFWMTAFGALILYLSFLWRWRSSR
jgi:heme/copper-type cytochrome/quinol oxidase subunit 1